MPLFRRKKKPTSEAIGDTRGETGAVDIKETRIEVGGPTGSVASPEADREAIRDRERRATPDSELQED
jgi:hypothetical protein